MEGRRRDNQRRRKPPRGFWQPTVPAWEREFCKVVGSMDWETLQQMQKYTHLYANVMEWDDSAGEEAFSNAKKCYWAKKNGLSCDISMPDPDLYIDNINWDSDIDLKLELLSDVESLPMSSKTEEDHDPVVIFGDSATPYQVSATVGWGDDEENLVVPATCFATNYADTWGHSLNEWVPPAWPEYSNDGWKDYPNDAWQYNDGNGNGYMPWEGWSWNYANGCYNYVGPEIRDTWDDETRTHGNDSNVAMTGSGGGVWSCNTSRAQANEQRRKLNKAPFRKSSSREWNSKSITVGHTWDRE